MNSLIEEQRQRLRLINELMPWWKKNGWRAATLEAKSLRELVAIKARHEANAKKSLMTRRSGQQSMYFN